jgi:hypothetical protein
MIATKVFVPSVVVIALKSMEAGVELAAADTVLTGRSTNLKKVQLMKRNITEMMFASKVYMIALPMRLQYPSSSSI